MSEPTIPDPNDLKPIQVHFEISGAINTPSFDGKVIIVSIYGVVDPGTPGCAFEHGGKGTRPLFEAVSYIPEDEFDIDRASQEFDKLAKFISRQFQVEIARATSVAMKDASQIINAQGG